MAEELDKYYTPRVVATALGISLDALYKLIKNQEIELIKIHKLYRIPRKSVEEFLERNTVKVKYDV